MNPATQQQMRPGDNLFLGEGDLLVMIGRLVAENNLLTTKIQVKDQAYSDLLKRVEAAEEALAEKIAKTKTKKED